MMHINIDEMELDDCSLCEDCAKHPSLRRFIERTNVVGPVCGICLRDPDQTRYKVADPSKREGLSNLLRALIRFYYDEEQYNPHFGGEFTPAALLYDENPIVQHEKTDIFLRTPGTSEAFLDSLFEPAYPDPDKGVSVYAGFSDNVRLANFAIEDGSDYAFLDIARRIRVENHFQIEPDLMDIFDRVGKRIEKRIDQGLVQFRARIGVAGKYRSHSDGFKVELKRQPYQGKCLGAPPPMIAGTGRLNRAGVSFLYLASDMNTAAAEVRPHPGHHVSVGQFRAKRPLRIANFDVEIDDFAASDNQLELFSFLRAADKAMSLPIVPEEVARYSLTQLIADVARQRGFDGVAFQSSIATGQNVCIFDASAFEYIPDSAKVVRVAALRYDIEEVASLNEPTHEDFELKG